MNGQTPSTESIVKSGYVPNHSTSDRQEGLPRNVHVNIKQTSAIDFDQATKRH